MNLTKLGIVILLLSCFLAQAQSGFQKPPGFSKVQYIVTSETASQVLEETRSRLENMIKRRGYDPQVILLTGDMVRNWKRAKDEFEIGNYAETVRICEIIQRYIF
jgi:hypothetical protein